MIIAQNSFIWKKLITMYFVRRIRKTFFCVAAKGVKELESWHTENAEIQDKNIPLILYCNHASWWDAAITIVLSLRTFSFDAYGMMEEKQLAKYSFFRKIGMFSVVREDAESAMQSLRYCAELLRNSRRVLWIFPQGTIEHPELKPISFYPGVGILAQKLQKAAFAPVALRYEFLNEERPECYISIGTPEIVEWGEESTIRNITAHFHARLEREMDLLRSDILSAKLQDYTVIIKGALSINKKWDRARGL